MQPNYFDIAVQQLRHHAPRLTLRDSVEASKDPLAVPGEMHGPFSCCADFAHVVACVDGYDTWTCQLCGSVWEAICR